MKTNKGYLKFLLDTFSHKNRKTKAYLKLRTMIFPRHVFDTINQKIDLKNKTIIDIGCGYGIIPLFFQHKKRPTKSVKGIDIDQKRIKDLQELAEKNNRQHLQFQVYDLIKEGPNKIEKSDIALMFDLLHHVDKKTQELLLEHLSSISNTIVIKDIDRKPKRKYMRNFFHDRYLMQNKILCFQGSKKIKEKLESLGYKVYYQKVSSIFPYPHYLLIAQK